MKNYEAANSPEFVHTANVATSHGRHDISSPANTPIALAASIPDAELFIAETEGHGRPTLANWMTTIADRLAE
jgi:hypothetical protein